MVRKTECREGHGRPGATIAQGWSSAAPGAQQLLSEEAQIKMQAAMLFSQPLPTGTSA